MLPDAIEAGRLARSLRVPPGPDRLHARLVHVRDRLDDSVRPGVADVVVRERDDVDAGPPQPDLQCGVEREPQAVRMVAEVVGRGALVVDDGDVGRLEEPPHGPGLPPARLTVAETAVQQRRDDLRRPPSQGKSGPLPRRTACR